ncbi:monocarboxylate transporter 6 [Galendromus occidentalis]|uniref:Monocarboxylate transporter 6 n=1 Tax=Galendromus occidentalis TaxID=34638 RepID=A0AAJ7PAY0_9ACAR|nr:monocarboxylate transporter 6 [Galendromus occidentalis]
MQQTEVAAESGTAPPAVASDDPMKKYLNHAQGPDSIRAWYVAFFAVLYVFFSWCAFSSTPVLYVALMETNPWLSRETASWPFTVMSCCTFTGSAIFGLLVRRVSERNLLLLGTLLSSSSLLLSSFFTHNVTVLAALLGLGHGFGIAGSTCIPSAVITQHFIKYRATAMSLFSIFASLSGIIYPILATFVYREYSLSGLLLILSALSCNQLLSVIVCDAAPWKAALQSLVASKAADDKKSGSERFCRPLLVNTCITNALSNFIMFALVLFVIDFETDNGIDSADGAFLVVMTCFGWLIASIFVGPIVDRGKYYDRYVILSSCVLQALALMFMISPIGKGVYWCQSLASFFVGWGQGSRGFLMFVMLSKKYSPNLVPMAFAVMNLSCFLPFLLRTPLIGLIRDNLGEYDYIFYLFIFINFILTVDWLAMSIWK